MKRRDGKMPGEVQKEIMGDVENRGDGLNQAQCMYLSISSHPPIPFVLVSFAPLRLCAFAFSS
jgi:hypothetical protein